MGNPRLSGYYGYLIGAYMEYLILYLSLLALVLLGVVTWLVWQPVKRLSLIELQVQEFRQQVRDWESAN